MSNLEQRLQKLMLRLDQMGLQTQQALTDALSALRWRDPHAAQAVREHDTAIDREEVEIERECVRMLALYQPTAVDLRTICTVIKVNNDIERIADLATSIAKRTRHAIAENLDVTDYPDLMALADEVQTVLARTLAVINAGNLVAAREIINDDARIDRRYKEFVSQVLASQRSRTGGIDAALTLIHLAKALERIGDLCTNIAEDMIFLHTGDVVRHPAAFGRSQA